MARTVAALLTQSRLDFADSVLIGTSSSNVCKLQLVQNCLAIECYFKTIPIQLPASYCNFTGFQSSSELNSKLQHLHAIQLLLVSPLISLQY